MVAVDDRTTVAFSLSPGQAGDAPKGRGFLKMVEGCGWEGANAIMDKAYEGKDARLALLDLGMIPVVQSKINRLNPWGYEREVYRKRNKVERVFRRTKGFRRIFSHFDKLDIIFNFFDNFPLISDRLISVNRS